MLESLKELKEMYERQLKFTRGQLKEDHKLSKLELSKVEFMVVNLESTLVDIEQAIRELENEKEN